MPPVLASLARRQHGVVSRDQALDAGLTAAQVRGLVRRGVWLRVYPRVYVVAGAPVTEVARLWAVRLSSAGPLWFTGVAGARLWGLDPLPPLTTVDAAVLKGRSAAERPSVRWRRCRPLPGTAVRGGLPVLSVPDVLLDCAATVGERAALPLVQETLRRRPYEEPALSAALRRGRAGSAAMRRILAVVGDGADSAWERRLVALCRAGGLPTPTRPILRSASGHWFRPDLYWPGVVVEVDGWSTHRAAAAFQPDRRRQNALVLELGLTVLRYTPVDIRDRPEDVVGEIRRALRSVAS